MLNILKTNEINTSTITTFETGSWVILNSPRSDEVNKVAENCNIDPSDLRAALDREEISRLESWDDYSMILVDIPSITIKNKKSIYTTIPLSIIYSKDYMITVCLENNPVVQRLKNSTNIFTFKKTQLLYKILLNNARLYMEYLIKINSMRNFIEQSPYTKETLTELYELEKSLMYFRTSLRSNALVLDRLLKYNKVKKYEEDQELLDDVLIEYKQAIEMTQIYYDMLDNTISKYNALMDYELNNAMKLLTSITIVLAIPTVVSGFFGMNVINMPFCDSPQGFWSIFILTFIICLITLIWLKKRKML